MRGQIRSEPPGQSLGYLTVQGRWCENDLHAHGTDNNIPFIKAQQTRQLVLRKLSDFTGPIISVMLMELRGHLVIGYL